MAKKEFNRSLDRYISQRTPSKKFIKLEDLKAKLKPTFGKVKPKFKETNVEFVEHEDIGNIEKKKPFFKRIFCRNDKKKRENLVDEELNPVYEEFEFEAKKGEDMEELEEGLAEIEEIETRQKSEIKLIHRMMNKLKFLGRIAKKEKEELKEEAQYYEDKADDVKDDIRTLIDFSVDILKILPAKDFKKLKEKESFQNYKLVIRKHMPSKKE